MAKKTQTKFEVMLANLVFVRYIQYQPRPAGVRINLVEKVFVSKMLRQCTDLQPLRKTLWAYYQAGIAPTRIEDMSRIDDPKEMLEQVAALVYLHLLNSNSIPKGLDWKTFIGKLEVEFTNQTKAEILERWKEVRSDKKK